MARRTFHGRTLRVKECGRLSGGGGNDQDLLVDRKNEGIPFQPWAKAIYDYRVKTEQKDDPEGLCLPPSGPLATLNRTASPWEFLQLPEQKRIIRIFEGGGHMFQIIYMDGRPHPQEAYDLPSWMGHSIGHWDGDTLVVDTVGFNEGQWLSTSGLPRTNLLHLIERYTRTGPLTMKYEVTIDDPGAYSKQWSNSVTIPFRPGEALNEYICQEGERDTRHTSPVRSARRSSGGAKAGLYQGRASSRAE